MSTSFQAAIQSLQAFVTAQGHDAPDIIWVRPGDVALWGRFVLITGDQSARQAALGDAELAYSGAIRGSGHVELHAFAKSPSQVYACVYVPSGPDQAINHNVNGLKLSVRQPLMPAVSTSPFILAAARMLRRGQQGYVPFLLGLDETVLTAYVP